MSLVDYASSSDDDEQIEEDEAEEKQQDPAGPSLSPPPPPPAPQNPPNRNLVAQSHQISYSTSEVSPMPPQSVGRLPDVSLLFASPSLSLGQITGNDHASRVAAARVESASRKRESNGSALPHPLSKFPKGHLPHLRSVPETVGGVLIPPQLRGRSNVVTEDIGKLFVHRPPDSTL